MASKRSLAPPRSSEHALEHLETLARAHDEVLAALSCKRNAISAPNPDAISISRARWNVSRASRAHRTLINIILGDLMVGAGTVDLAAIDELRRSGIQQTQRSTYHVQRWTADRIMTEWSNFCSDSARIQAEMQLQIRTEQLTIGRMLHHQAFVASQ